jgi:hypothetical protein
MQLPTPPQISQNNENLTADIAAVEQWALRNDPMWANWQHFGEHSEMDQRDIYRIIAARQLAERYRLQNELIRLVELSPNPPRLFEANSTDH